MPSFPSKDDGFRPHKRTGVWSTETVRQKSSVPERIPKLPTNDSFDSNTLETEDDARSSSTKINFNDVVKSPTKSKLLKLPALENFKDINIGLLLNRFNDEEDIKDLLDLVLEAISVYCGSEMRPMNLIKKEVFGVLYHEIATRGFEKKIANYKEKMIEALIGRLANSFVM